MLFYKGNQTCLRCHKLEKELDEVKKGIVELKLKHNKETQNLEKEGKKREGKFRKANEGLEQKIGNLTREKNEIELQLCSDNEQMEELKHTNEKLLEEIESKKKFIKVKEKRCHELCSEIKRLRMEHAKSQSKCETLDKEVKKYKNSVSRKY